MAIGRRSSIVGPLKTLWMVGVAGETDDQALLSRYALSQDGDGEEAFRVLVERHGPMVFRVCQQVIGDLQLAEDATQAVFLVLARKAASIRVEGSVAPWLHGVARRVATKARGRAATRRQAESRSAGVAASLRDRDRAGDGEPDAGDWELVHEEVGRLPEKYRTPVVLCYLQEQTYEQAARQIGCPVGTVRIRLSRARERLRCRLQRRGLGPERVTAVGLFRSDSGPVLLPATAVAPDTVLYGATQVETTLKAVRALGMGRDATVGTVTASVLKLYQGAIRAMMINRWITVGACLVAAGITGAGAIVLAAGGTAGQDKAAPPTNQPTAASAPTPSPKPENEPVIDPDSPETFRKQTERRLIAARQRLDAQRAFYEEGRITIDRFIDASRQLMLAETAASSSREQRVAAAKAHWSRMAEVLKREQEELELGRSTIADVSEAMDAQENAALEYIAVRQSRSPTEVESLRQRVDTLENQLESIRKQLALPRTGRQ